jgi:hypothetical protein
VTEDLSVAGAVHLGGVAGPVSAALARLTQKDRARAHAERKSRKRFLPHYTWA